MANVEEKKSVPERIDKNDNWEFSQQEIKDFIFDKKNGQQNIKDLVNFLEESKQNRLDPYGKDKYFVDNFQNIMDGLEISEMFTKIDEKINKNENLTNDEKSLIYLDAITVGKRRKNTYDMSSGGIIHREIFLKDSKTPFNPNDPIRKICDGEFLNYIRCCYGNQNYNPEQYSPIPDKGSTIQDNKNYIKDPIKFKQEKEKERIKSEYEGLPQIPPISQRGNEYIHSYCNMIYKRAEDNGYLVMAEYESRLRNEFRSHVEYNENGEGEYVHDKEFDAYVRYDKLLFAFQKYCEVINKKHEQVIKEAGYHDIDEFSQEMKYFGLFQDLIKEKYPDLEEVLKRLEPYWTEIEENKNKYFGGKSDEEIEKAGKDFLEFQEFQNKKNEEYGITNEMIESLNETPSTKEETENYFKNLDKILKFQCELNIKRGEYGEDTIDNYYEYITNIKNIQGKYNESDFNILKNYSTDLQQRGKSINFDRCSKYAAMIDRKGKYSQLGKDLENVGIISEILSDPTGEYFPIFEVKNAEMEKKLKQESIDKTRENIKKHAPGLYRVSTVVTGFWNGLVDSTIGVGTSLGAMITGLIGGKDHYQSQMQKKERWDNFFKINQTSSQKQAVYDPESGSLNFKRDNTVTTVSSSIAQMLCLIYGGSAVGKGIGKLGTKAGLTISENVVSRAGLFGMSFITQVGQSYGEAINSGLDGTGAFAYSMLSASIQSGLELVSPNDVLLGKGTGLGKQLISSICKNEGGIKLVGKYFLKSVGREILEENLQEGLQLAAGNLVNDMVNGVRNTGLESDRNPKNFLSTAIITTLTTGITTGFSAGKKGLQMMRSSQPQLMARISSDQDLYNDVINIINNSINGKFQIPNVDPKQLTALKYTLELMNTEGNNDQQENSQNNAENNNQEPENQENTDTETQTKKKREKKKDKDYFDGQSHEFDVTQDQAIKNSQYMDNILESINEGNMVNELDNLRKRISEQYHEATGENIELTDEQLLSILDAHEQDGILGELTIGQLKQKVKILSETVTDPKFRRFLFEAGFCGKYLELTELQQEKIDYLRKHEVRINEENIDYLSTLTESEMREISSFQMDCGISFIKTDAAKLLQLSEEEKEWVIEASKFGFVDYKYDDVMEISKIDEKGKNILRELNTIGLEGSFSSYSVKDLSKLTSNDVNKLKKMKSMGYPIRYFFYDIIENLSNDQINMLYQLYKMRVEIPGVGWSEIVGKMTPEIVTKIKNEGSAEIILEGGEKVNLVRDSYFNGKAHQFNVTESQAIDNSQKMDYILNNVNEENLSRYLQSMREDINEQYFITTGENIELTDEQLLSILDAHVQDGILGELTTGQLKQKVKILAETITDPKIRRFLLEAGFCGSMESTEKLDKLINKFENNRGYSKSTITEIINFTNNGQDATRLGFIEQIARSWVDERNIKEVLNLYNNGQIAPYSNELILEQLAFYAPQYLKEYYRSTHDTKEAIKKINEIETLGLRVSFYDFIDYEKRYSEIEYNHEKFKKIADLCGGLYFGNFKDLENFINKYNEIEFDFEKLGKLRDLGVEINIRNIKGLNNIEYDFEKLERIRDEFGIKINKSNIEKLNNIEYDFEKLIKLRDLGVKFVKPFTDEVTNIWRLNNTEFDFKKLNMLKDEGFNISDKPIEFNELNLSEQEILFLKKNGITEFSDIKFFISMESRINRKKISAYIKRKNEYLEKNRTISEEKFMELFGIVSKEGIMLKGKYGKTEINQKYLGLCYYYSGMELLKKTNGFNELIQTNLKESGNGWEVRVPFCDPIGIRIKVNKNEINQIITIKEEDGTKRTVSINSESESLGFKILEIAFMKKEIINRYLRTIPKGYRIMKNAYEQFSNTGDITLTGDLIALLEGGNGDGMWKTMIPSSYYTFNGYVGKDAAFNLFNQGLRKITLEVQPEQIKAENFNSDPEIDINDGKIIVNNAKIINKTEEPLPDSDIIKSKDGRNTVCFISNHEYSIERCYIDNNTGEKRVWVINPWHTGIKFDISLEQCKQIFEHREVTGINIDAMFKEGQEDVNDLENGENRTENQNNKSKSYIGTKKGPQGRQSHEFNITQEQVIESGQEVEIKTNLEKLQEKLDLMCESNVTAENCGLTEEQINQVYDLFGKIKGITGQDKLTETQLKRIVEEKIKVNDLEYVSGIRDRLKILTGNETISFETMLKILSYNEYFFDKAISEASLKTGNKRIETELCRFFDTYFLYLTDNEFKNKLIKIVGNEYQDILGTLFTADPNKINNILDIILNSQQTYTKLEQMHTELKMSRGGLLNMFSEFDNFEFDGVVFKLTKDGRTEYMILNEYGVIELEYIGNKTYIFHAGMSTEDPKMKLKVHYLVGKIFKHMANQIPEGYRITETHSLSGNSFPLFLREYQSDFTIDYIVKATGKMIYLNSQGVDTELSKLISDLNVGENDDIFEASTRENAEKVVKKINELILKDHGKSINDGKGIQGLPTATVVESLETGLRRVAIPQIEILKEHNNGAELAQKLNKCTTYNEMENILLENLTTEYHFRDGDLTGEELLQRCRAYRETYVNGGDKLPKNVNPRKFFPSEFIVPSKRKSTDGKPIWRNTTWKSHIHKLLDSK